MNIEGGDSGAGVIFEAQGEHAWAPKAGGGLHAEGGGAITDCKSVGAGGGFASGGAALTAGLVDSKYGGGGGGGSLRVSGPGGRIQLTIDGGGGGPDGGGRQRAERDDDRRVQRSQTQCGLSRGGEGSEGGAKKGKVEGMFHGRERKVNGE